MRQREFLSALGSAAAAWPVVARAQNVMPPVVGFLNAGSPATFLVQAYRQGLSAGGFVDGQNISVTYRWAEGRYDLLPALASDLVRERVAVIAASGTSAPALAAKAVTTKIPIVFTSGDDPVKVGLVSSLNRPGGNVTGVHLFLTELSAKKLGLLNTLLPKNRIVGACLNRSSQNVEIQATEVEAAGRTLGVQIVIAYASNEPEIEAAVASLVQQRAGALVVGSDPFYLALRERFVLLAARHAIPAVYPSRDYVEAGGLLSYGTSIRDGYREAGIYTAHILKGEKPSDLPVMQSRKFEFVVNLRTAKALGLDFHPQLLATADEVIE